MSDNNEDKKPKKFVLNSYWIYGLIIFIILALNVVTMINGKTSELTPYKFKEMAMKGHVKSVEVVNKNLVKVFVKKDSLVHYPDVSENKFNVQQPHFAFEIGEIRVVTVLVVVPFAIEHQNVISVLLD